MGDGARSLKRIEDPGVEVAGLQPHDARRLCGAPQGVFKCLLVVRRYLSLLCHAAQSNRIFAASSGAPPIDMISRNPAGCRNALLATAVARRDNRRHKRAPFRATVKRRPFLAENDARRVSYRRDPRRNRRQARARSTFRHAEP
jgi:hypothetical protein